MALDTGCSFQVHDATPQSAQIIVYTLTTPPDAAAREPGCGDRRGYLEDRQVVKYLKDDLHMLNRIEFIFPVCGGVEFEAASNLGHPYGHHALPTGFRVA